MFLTFCSQGRLWPQPHSKEWQAEKVQINQWQLPLYTHPIPPINVQAGASVVHAGKIGKDGLWIKELMLEKGVNVDLVLVDDEGVTGRALIQVSEETGDNCIILHGGTNKGITGEDVAIYKSHCGFVPGNWVMMQNEVNCGRDIMEAAISAGMIVCFNPAPMASDLLLNYPLECVHVLIMNETESAALWKLLAPDGQDSLELTSDIVASSLSILADLCVLLPANIAGILITLGEHGLIAQFKDPDNDQWTLYKIPAIPTKVVDTTGAGDTFVGYVVATLSSQIPVGNTENVRFDPVLVKQALERATCASSLACSKEGAIPSIPSISEVISSPTFSK